MFIETDSKCRGDKNTSSSLWRLRSMLILDSIFAIRVFTDAIEGAELEDFTFEEELFVSRLKHIGRS